MATGPVTTKKRANQTTYTQVPTGQYDPFGGSNAFQTQDLPAYTPATRAPSVFTTEHPGSNGGWSNLAANSTVTDVPQSYIDQFANNNDQGGSGGTPAAGVSQEQFDQAIRYSWSILPNDQKQQYITKDQQAVAGLNQQQLQGITTQAVLGAPAQDARVANQLWQPVTQAQQRAVAAQNAQVTGDRQAEQDLNARVGEYTNTIRGNQDARMADINATNAGNTKDSQDFLAETLAANQRNTGFANQLTAAANNTNALQTQQYNTFANQMSGYNANQNALLGNFMGDIASSNAQQNQNLAQFGGAVSGANAQSGAILNQFGGAVNTANANQNAIVAQYSQQLAAMNKQDQAAYLQYLNETNPLMAQLVAQGSNPAYVHNMEDVVSRYRDLSAPQVTDQERFLAELARRKFEGDDQASREAVMQQLATRGLKSGGLAIAGQQAAHEQLSQDRMLNELGLNAQAVSRGMQGMAGYMSASSALRNADDAMRNFQDQYAQNEYVRRGNLAQQRDQQELNTSAQVTGRDTANYNARTQSNQLNYGRAQDYYNASRQTNQDIYGRNLDYYNAGTQTVNDNFSRTQAGYNAGTQTNQDNSLRDQMTFNAGRTTNVDNFGRTQTEIGGQVAANQTNLGNYQNALTGPAGTITTRSDNSTRTQGGLDKGDLGAGSILGAQTGAIGFRTGNLASEAQSQNGYVPIAAGAAATGTNIQAGLTQEQLNALKLLSGNLTAEQQRAILGQN